MIHEIADRHFARHDESGNAREQAEREQRTTGEFDRAGEPLKRIAVTFAELTVRGEAVITADGLEGGAIYALSALLRDAIRLKGEAVLSIDLRPYVAEADLAAHIAGGRKKESLSTSLRKTAKLSATAIDLLREAATHNDIRLGDLPPRQIARLIKAVPVRLTGIAGIARAISTAGGVSRAGARKAGVSPKRRLLSSDTPRAKSRTRQSS